MGKSATKGRGPSRPKLPASSQHVPWWSRVWQSMKQWEATLSSFSLILSSSVLLIVLGLGMVLSSSFVTQLQDDKSVFSELASQGSFALLGVIPLVVGARLPLTVWRRLAWPLLFFSLIGVLLLFTGLGLSSGGNRAWVNLGFATFQPAEAAKLALIVWTADVLANKAVSKDEDLLSKWTHVVVPVGVVGAAFLGLVLAGRDLGTSLVIMGVMGVMLYAAGVSYTILGTGVAAGAVLSVMLVLSSESRMRRVTAWISGEDDAAGTSWQSVHGLFALASGGLWGLGLGASREKWHYLPEAHNDFIFAIIGEELGILGTVGVVALFSVLGFAAIRIVLRHPDPFVKIAMSGMLAWLVGQAFINMAVVVGLLPVLGVPLPFVSSGGSSLVMAMTGVGFMLAVCSDMERQHLKAAKKKKAPALPRQQIASAPVSGSIRQVAPVTKKKTGSSKTTGRTKKKSSQSTKK